METFLHLYKVSLVVKTEPNWSFDWSPPWKFYRPIWVKTWFHPCSFVFLLAMFPIPCTLTGRSWIAFQISGRNNVDSVNLLVKYTDLSQSCFHSHSFGFVLAMFPILVTLTWRSWISFHISEWNSKLKFNVDCVNLSGKHTVWFPKHHQMDVKDVFEF